MEDRMDAYDVAHQAQGLYINYAYMWGLLPFHYEVQDISVHYIKSQMLLLRFYVTIVLCTIGRIALTLALIIEFILGRVVFSPYYIFRTVFLAFYLYTGSLHLHSTYRRYMLQSMINTDHAYYKLYIDTYTKKMTAKELENDYCGTVMQAFFALSILLSLSMTGMYIFQCELHFMAPILPICTPEFRIDGSIIWRHGEKSYHIMCIFLQFMISSEIVGSSFVYIGTGMPAVYFGVDMVKELFGLGDKGKTTLLLQEPRHWFRHYNCVRILMIQVNECFSDFIILMLVAGVTVLSVITNFILLKVRDVFALTICFSVVNLFILGFLFVITSQAGKFWHITQKALRERGRYCRTKYLTKLLKSHAPYGVLIAHYRRLDNALLLIVYSAIIDYTISLQLAY